MLGVRPEKGQRKGDGMKWISKLFGRGHTSGCSRSAKINVNVMTYDELMKTAQEGFLDGVDDATRVRCLRRAASIASQSGDITKQLTVNAVIQSFRQNGLIQ